MPGLEDVVVDATADSGNLPSPLTGGASASSNVAEEGGDAGCPSVLNSIWDCPKLQPNVLRDGVKGWICHWCGKFFRGVHATRALNHVIKNILKANVKMCSAVIPEESTAR